MGLMERPEVKKYADGGKSWEHTYEKFSLKAYVPATRIDGEVNNYTFRAPLLLVFEEKEQGMDEAIEFAKKTGLADIASAVDSSVLFIYPTSKDWKKEDESLYAAVIAEVKMDPNYADGIVSLTNFFTREFKGYFVRGAIFRADIYSFGESADYVAKNLLKKIDGEYLWGPGEITPAMCSMERLSVVPVVERTDIGVLSVGNTAEMNKAFEKCQNLLIKDEAEYRADFKSFVRKFKMWCGNMEIEPDFEALNMTEEAGEVLVKTSPDHMGAYKGTETHKVGYFAYYNNGIFDDGPVPTLIGFHGGGDSSMFLTFVSGWWQVCHDHNFLYVSIENHQNVTATEAAEVIAELKNRYKIDEHRIYAAGFSMGSGKTWNMFEEYPELFAGCAPASALFPVYNNPFGTKDIERINKTVQVPMFYSGGELSHLPELAFQAESAVERVTYLSEVNKFKKKYNVKFEDKENWENKIWGINGDKTEVFEDPARGSKLTVQYFESEDGVIRTALASVDNQVHEYRHHTADTAWKFISQFTR